MAARKSYINSKDCVLFRSCPNGGGHVVPRGWLWSRSLLVIKCQCPWDTPNTKKGFWNAQLFTMRVGIRMKKKPGKNWNSKHMLFYKVSYNHMCHMWKQPPPLLAQAGRTCVGFSIGKEEKLAQQLSLEPDFPSGVSKRKTPTKTDSSGRWSLNWFLASPGLLPQGKGRETRGPRVDFCNLVTLLYYDFEPVASSRKNYSSNFVRRTETFPEFSGPWKARRRPGRTGRWSGMPQVPKGSIFPIKCDASKSPRRFCSNVRKGLFKSNFFYRFVKNSG